METRYQRGQQRAFQELSENHSGMEMEYMISRPNQILKSSRRHLKSCKKKNSKYSNNQSIRRGEISASFYERR